MMSEEAGSIHGGGGVRVLSARSMDGVELGASRMLTPLLT